mmetsp:Transcript_28048/g.65155  ORF Transcript_28048/g.65155 Transcript_28048/m.65155 type:complete len:84 (+) Transcript_28048:83-334(+)
MLREMRDPFSKKGGDHLNEPSPHHSRPMSQGLSITFAENREALALAAIFWGVYVALQLLDEQWCAIRQDAGGERGFDLISGDD